ncbi:terminase large subunit [Algimonas porphyrae]|uniref:Phage terminase n=1 Tax=Algimonas porphyrae TaxID=1128113 RepID=A0ABQ5UZW0_9PROT|nr:terminase TerL endonuclease subunit [Algimonas porphyrae]GLQ20382.1 phage terminase [Algimonas porphyrae]
MARLSARAKRVIEFVERFCVTPEGKHVGKPIRLAPFQKKFIGEIYGSKRRARRAILSIARKNGKSALIACLILVHLVGPEAVRNSQIVSGARSRDQAALVFNLARKMIDMSPELSARIGVVPSSKRLIGLAMNVEYRALSADAATNHGLSPVLAIFDELGQVRGPNDDFVEAIETASGAYDDALQITISTQARSDADMLSMWIDEARAANDNETVCHVYEADADADLECMKAAKAANPGLGYFRSEVEYKSAMRRAARSPSFENSFRSLYLNQRINRNDPFASPKAWKAAAGDPGSPEGHTVYAGLDLARTTDLTALVLAWRADGKLRAHAHFWMPGDTIEDRTNEDRAPYSLWAEQGFIRTTPGAVLDYGFLARDIAEICAGLDVAALGYDRWQMKTLMPEFERVGVELPFEEFGQGFASMAPALNALETDLIGGTLAHGDNPVLNMCAFNAVVTMDPAGNRKLDKAKSSGRIDGMVALTIARGMEAKGMETHFNADDWITALAG